MDRRILDLITKIGFVYKSQLDKYTCGDYVLGTFTTTAYNPSGAVSKYCNVNIYCMVEVYKGVILKTHDIDFVYTTISNEFKSELRELNINKIIDG